MRYTNPRTHSLTVSKRGHRPIPHPTPSHLVRRRPVPSFSRRDNYSTSGRNVAKGRRHVAHAVDDVGREAATAAAAAAADSRRMINGKSRIEFASVKRVSDTYSVQRPLERRVQRRGGILPSLLPLPLEVGALNPARGSGEAP